MRTMTISPAAEALDIGDEVVDGHEEVLYCHDDESGLRAIIAIHDTTLGPALGGTRFKSYDTDQDALHDVLRLSRGMTSKNAAAGLPFGGGKAVIIGDPRTAKTPELLRPTAGSSTRSTAATSRRRISAPTRTTSTSSARPPLT